MVKANTYGIKLLISMHSWNALVRPDVYGQWYGTGYFYEEQQAMDEFDNRLRHILNHNHTTLHKPWKELYNHIFAFEAENEAMIGNGEEYIQQHQYWQCDRAKTIKSELGENSGILVTTGGESWMSESVQPGKRLVQFSPF
jgi:mannan endo-1,4-beta-mannosidase